jgi:hypothetical protein
MIPGGDTAIFEKQEWIFLCLRASAVKMFFALDVFADDPRPTTNDQFTEVSK